MITRDLQREAVEAARDAPLKLVAGAGTGKTRTMVDRFANLVQAHGLDPTRIVAVTFTNKAAAELRDRVTTTLLERGLVNDRAALDPAWIGTFHGLCTRLLREDCYEVGFDRETRVIDQLEERLLVRDVQDALRNNEVAGAGILEMESIGIEDAVKLSTEAFTFIQRMKGRGLTPDVLQSSCRDCAEAYWRERVAEQRAGNGAAAADPPAGIDEQRAEREAAQLICATYHEYERRLRERRLLDFDGIILRTLQGLHEHPAWAQRCRERFQYIIVDEFQDTSRVQLDVLECIAQPGFANVAVVGDPKQSIYGWRDAQIGNLLDFPGDERRLLVNRRSVQPILDLATHVIRGDPRFADEPALVSDESVVAAPGAAVSLFRAGTAEEEARWVASTIVDLHDGGRAWSDIALLTRMRVPPIAFEQELRRAGVPYVTAGGNGFFAREEIKDVLAYLGVIDNPLDDSALTRMLQGPLVRVGDGELYRMLRERLGVSRSRGHFWDALVASEQDGFPELLASRRERVAQTLELVRRLAADRAGVAVSELVQEVIDRTGYALYAAAEPAETDRRLGNLRKLYRMAGDFEASTVFSGIGDFLEYVELHDEHDIDVAEADLAGADAVRFMTVHAAKGLEFPVVFFAHVKPLRSQHRGWLFFDDELGLIVKNLGGSDGKTTKHQEWLTLRSGDGTLPTEIERAELRRLVYVALTRAKQQLFVSATRKDEPDWDAVLAELDGKGKPRKEPENDHFRTMALYVRGRGDGVLLETAEPAGQQHLQLTVPESAAPPLPSLVLPPQAPESGAVPARREEVSFTQLEVLGQCPLRYRYMFEWEVPAVPDDLWPDSARHQNAVAASTLGTLVHAVLERSHQPGAGILPGGIEALRAVWDAVSVGILTAPESDALWENDARQMFENYLASGVAELETVAVEQEVNLVVSAGGSEVLIRGFIDRLCRNPDGSLLVLDYKTNRGMSSATHAAHDRQLAIYRRAVTEALRMSGPVDAAVIEMRTGALHRARPGGWEAVEVLLRQLVDGTRTAPLNPPCSGCAYADSCPASTRRQTQDGTPNLG